MGAAENKARTIQFVDEVFNKGNLSYVDKYSTPNLIDHALLPGMTPGPAGLKQFVTGLRTAFPDLHYTVQDSVVEGDKVVTRATARGTMKGDFMNMPASGKSAQWEEIHITRFAEGLAVEHWGIVDQLSMLTQLGFVNMSQEAASRR
jgi:predicted ester cyclase